LEHFVAGHRTIPLSPAKRVSGGSGGERLESQLAQVDGSPGIPRIWQHETSSGVQSAELFADGLLCAGHVGNLFRSRFSANPPVSQTRHALRVAGRPPTFDRPRYLQEAIEAVLAQTYSNIEVVPI
jgi:hypothetical protein